MSLDYFQLACTVIDIVILVLSIIKRDELLTGPFIWVFLGILTNFVWQVFNIQSHFRFLRKEKPSNPLVYLYKDEHGKNDFSRVNIASDLLANSLPYVRDDKMGIMRNPDIDAILRGNAPIEANVSDKKTDYTRRYIKQYKETLLIFLNHKWHEVNYKGGQFDNESKLCFASELYCDKNGNYKWAVCKGAYYNGYITNNIFCQYIGGSHYSLYPPRNVTNTVIKSFSDSDFSDHIGVSTLLITSDKEPYSVVFRQSNSSAQGPGKLVSSGSGSIDFADFREGEDLRKVVIRAAERELFEETKLEETIKDKNWEIKTRILGYYRDMERGGKPEFCCVTEIDVPKEALAANLIDPNPEELAENDMYFPFVHQEADWQALMPEASLSLKMNYEFLKLEIQKQGE